MRLFYCIPATAQKSGFLSDPSCVGVSVGQRQRSSVSINYNLIGIDSQVVCHCL